MKRTPENHKHGSTAGNLILSYKDKEGGVTSPHGQHSPHRKTRNKGVDPEIQITEEENKEKGLGAQPSAPSVPKRGSATRNVPG